MSSGRVLLEKYTSSPWYLWVDPSTGGTACTFRFRTPRTGGFYDEVAGKLVLFYRDQQRLILSIDGKVYPLTANLTAQWQECELPTGKDEGTFALRLDGTEIVVVAYPIPVTDLDRADPNFESGRNDLLRFVAGVIATPSNWPMLFTDHESAE